MMKSYGIRESTDASSEVELHAESIRVSGYTVLRQLASGEALVRLREALDRTYETQAAEVGGVERLRSIGDADVARCLLAYDPLFLTIAIEPRVLALAERLMGDYFLLQQQNGIINRPIGDNYQSAWHRDLPYQHFVASRPISLSVLWCVDDFNESTGGTWVLPASHKTEPFPSAAYVAAHETPIVAKAGDALAFDSMLFHRAGHNRSPNVRRGLNHVYCLPFLKQQISLPRALGRAPDDPFLRRFLGYESEPGDSALEWRTRRLSKLPA